MMRADYYKRARKAQERHTDWLEKELERVNSLVAVQAQKLENMDKLLSKTNVRYSAVTTTAMNEVMNRYRYWKEEDGKDFVKKAIARALYNHKGDGGAQVGNASNMEDFQSKLRKDFRDFQILVTDDLELQLRRLKGQVEHLGEDLKKVSAAQERAHDDSLRTQDMIMDLRSKLDAGCFADAVLTNLKYVTHRTPE